MYNRLQPFLYARRSHPPKHDKRFSRPLWDKTAFQVVSPATDSEVVLRHHKMGCVRGISYKKDTRKSRTIDPRAQMIF